MRRYKVSFMVLILALAIFLCACSIGEDGSSVMSEAKANENLEKALGNVEELSMDIEEVKEKLSENVIVSSDKKEEEKSGTEIVVGDGVVLYHSVQERASKTTSGYDYTYTVEVMHFGGAEINGSDCNMKFVGANLTMKIEAENVEAVRTELLNNLEGADMTSEQKSVLSELIQGNKVYAEAGSEAWEMYSEVNEDVETTYDSTLGTFWQTTEPEYDEDFDQYSYETKDFSGRVKERIYYKLDESGKRWDLSINTYTYLSDGMIKYNHVYYHEYSTQIEMQSEYLLEEIEGGGKPIWSKTYRDDGVIEYEGYIDENGNDVIINYFDNGNIQYKRIEIPAEEYGDPGREIYREEYYYCGAIFHKYYEEGDLWTREEYFENGKLRERRTCDKTRYFEGRDEEPYCTEFINGFEDGSYTVFTFFDNGEWKSVKGYNAEGILVSDRELYENGKDKKNTHYHDDGTISYYDEYYENGNKKIMAEYDNSGNLDIYVTYYENGNENVEEQYNEGKLQRKNEYLENGDIKKVTVYNENGEIISEVDYTA